MQTFIIIRSFTFLRTKNVFWIIRQCQLANSKPLIQNYQGSLSNIRIGEIINEFYKTGYNKESHLANVSTNIEIKTITAPFSKNCYETMTLLYTINIKAKNCIQSRDVESFWGRWFSLKPYFVCCRSVNEQKSWSCLGFSTVLMNHKSF